METLHESIRRVLSETDSLWISRTQPNSNIGTSSYGGRSTDGDRYFRTGGVLPPPAMGRQSPAIRNRSLNDTSYGRLPPQLRGRTGRRSTPYSYDNLNSSPRYGFRGIQQPQNNTGSQYGENFANWLNQGMGGGSQIARFLNNY